VTETRRRAPAARARQSRQHAADAGQLHLDFDGAAPADPQRRSEAKVVRLAVVTEAAAAEARTAADWFRIGCELEGSAPAEAIDAYRRALALDSRHQDALLNLGRLWHEAGAIDEAESCYRRALALSPGEPVAAYNLGVALEDAGRLEDAAAAYEAALAADPANADACFNLAGVYERLGKSGEAVRWLKEYRRLRSEVGPADRD
jgi:tetratricopeptide (TPR) repeat protein